MGFFSSLKPADINAGVEEYKAAQGAFLIDVRTVDEYAAGHIEDSINIPLDRLEQIKDVVKEADAQIFTYCLSGARSSNAASKLKKMGYQNVKNIGGINGYRGQIVR